MAVNATGRYVPPKKPKPAPPPDPIAWQYGLPVPASPFTESGGLNFPLPDMPWWYPLMSFQAAVAREVLSKAEAGQSGVISTGGRDGR